MCGICGYYGEGDENLLKNMNSKIQHRGPNQSGFYTDKNIGLAHKRLSIIDLSENGRNPMHNEDESIWIIFNGEIYNFQEIKVNLENKGHKFYSETDTEMIVHAYEEYGKECVKKFNGMFAFAIWDSNKKELFLARDRLGIKPLHFFWNGKRMVFGSEIKSIIADPSIPRKLNNESVRQFFILEFIPSPNTIFEKIYKLKPGHTLTLRENKIHIEKYWDLRFEQQKHNVGFLTRQLHNLLQNAVEKRLMSDVPFGAFLSGGIDSSTIVAFMSKKMNQPVKTFSIGFPGDSYNELNDAKKVSELFGTDHYEKQFYASDMENIMKEIMPKIDEPFGDPSLIPTYLVSKLAKKKVTMILSGDGGDELFAGYDWYVANKIARYYQLIPGGRIIASKIIKKIKPTVQSKGLINKAKKFTEGVVLPKKWGHLRWTVSHDSLDKDIIKINSKIHPVEHLLKSAGAHNGLDRAQYVDIKKFMPDDILTKVDRASMLNSLEVRVPFLDHEVAEFAALLPVNLRLKGFDRKFILKKAVSKYFPKEILYKKKQGFTVPNKHFFRNELKSMIEETLSKRNINSLTPLNFNHVKKVINLHMSGRRDCQRHIWALLSFTLWAKNYLKE